MQDASNIDAKKRAFIARRRDKSAAPSMFGDDPVSRAWRSEQAHVDADIEGLARDPVADALVADMERKGLSDEERIKRLIAHYKERAEAMPAAE